MYMRVYSFELETTVLYNVFPDIQTLNLEI